MAFVAHPAFAWLWRLLQGCYQHKKKLQLEKTHRLPKFQSSELLAIARRPCGPARKTLSSFRWKLRDQNTILVRVNAPGIASL
jgi:hypothetical protein